MEKEANSFFNCLKFLNLTTFIPTPFAVEIFFSQSSINIHSFGDNLIFLRRNLKISGFGFLRLISFEKNVLVNELNLNLDLI